MPRVRATGRGEGGGGEALGLCARGDGDAVGLVGEAAGDDDGLTACPVVRGDSPGLRVATAAVGE